MNANPPQIKARDPQTGDQLQLEVLAFTDAWPFLTAHLKDGRDAVLMLDRPEHGWIVAPQILPREAA